MKITIDLTNDEWQLLRGLIATAEIDSLGAPEHPMFANIERELIRADRKIESTQYTGYFDVGIYQYPDGMIGERQLNDARERAKMESK